MNFDSSVIPVALVLFAPPLIFLLVILWGQRQRRLVEKPPQGEKLLRPPGYSLSMQFDEIVEAVFWELWKAFFLGSMVGSTALASYRCFNLHAPMWVSAVC